VLTLALAVVNTTGCTLYYFTGKHFEPEGEQVELRVFPDHELEFLIHNSIYADDGDRHGIGICQRQPAPPDFVDAGTLDYVQLDDLRLYVQIPRETFTAGIAEAGLPKDIAWLLDYLFATVVDGCSASLGDGVQRALDREPRDFADFYRAAAKSGVWNVSS